MKIVITGGSSGIGKAIIEELVKKKEEEIIIYNIDLMPCSHPSNAVVDVVTDITKEIEIVYAYRMIGEIDMLINCAGVNYINWIEKTPIEEWERIIDTNTKSIFILTQIFLKGLIENKGTILNIVSNASHMPMTNSIAYNASKGAAHIMTLQMSRELAPKGVTVFGISPNKVADTGMSKYIDETVCGLRGWTPEEAHNYQISSLPAGEETDKDTLAEFVVFLLSSKQRHKYLAGTILPYGK